MHPINLHGFFSLFAWSLTRKKIRPLQNSFLQPHVQIVCDGSLDSFSGPPRSHLAMTGFAMMMSCRKIHPDPLTCSNVLYQSRVATSSPRCVSTKPTSSLNESRRSLWLSFGL
jgi:hypothetical protein